MAYRTASRLQRLHQISVLHSCHPHRSCLSGLSAIPSPACPPPPPPLPLPHRRCYSGQVNVGSGAPPPGPSLVPPAVNGPQTRWSPPPLCPGCGAPSQQTDPSLPGHYGTKPRRRIGSKSKPGAGEADKLWEGALKRVEGDAALLRQLLPGDRREEGRRADRLSGSTAQKMAGEDDLAPICDRCHFMKHHHDAPSLPAYSTFKALCALLLSSRHRHNHIYHLVDAADFPLSLRPGLLRYLHRVLPRSLSRNLTISYVITRCDILMPKEKQISSYMTYFKSTLKRLIPKEQKLETPTTKVYAISSRTGWEIGALKKEISKRRGGVWFLGAVNVGKSTLLRDIWPMDGVLRPTTLEDAAEFDILPAEELENPALYPDEAGSYLGPGRETEEQQPDVEVDVTRPSVARAHVPPTVSDIPGTTAAPIRVSYQSVGRGPRFRGEVVDLPGLERWVGFKETGLMKYVRPNKRRELAMRDRVSPLQFVIKPGQSMLIGGLIMITPRTPNVPVLANPFTSLPIHVSSTAKCYGFLFSLDPGRALGAYAERFFQDPASFGLPLPTSPESPEYPKYPEPPKSSPAEPPAPPESPESLKPPASPESPKSPPELPASMESPKSPEPPESPKPPVSAEPPGSPAAPEPPASPEPPKSPESPAPPESPKSPESPGSSGSPESPELPVSSELPELPLLKTEESKEEEGEGDTYLTTLPPAFASAGIFTLSDDVTARRNQMLEERSPENIASLPYKVLATDILLEGLGWVELTAQVRNRRDTGYEAAQVEVFTPEGKGIGQRETMSVYMRRKEGAQLRGLHRRTPRPPHSMKGRKKQLKLVARRASS